MYVCIYIYILYIYIYTYTYIFLCIYQFPLQDCRAKADRRGVFFSHRHPDRKSRVHGKRVGWKNSFGIPGPCCTPLPCLFGVIFLAKLSNRVLEIDP